MGENLLTVGGTFGDYRVVRLLGTRGSVDVYLIESTTTGRLFAMKTFLAEDGHNDETLRMFSEKLEGVKAIRNDNLVLIHDFGEDPDTGLFYLIMDYVPGGTLAGKLALEGPMDVAAAVKYAVVAARTLDAVHRSGMTHGGIKPENILFSSDGTLKLADLGLSMMLNSGDALRGAEISPYVAPERVTGASPVDCRSDVYSLGVMLFEMLTGVKPPSTPTMVELVVKVANNDLVPDVRTLRQDVPEPVARAVAKLCAPKAEDRPATAADAADMLLAAIGGGAPSAYGAKQHGARVAMKPTMKQAVKPKKVRISMLEDSAPEKGGGGKLLAIFFLLVAGLVGAAFYTKDKYWSMEDLFGKRPGHAHEAPAVPKVTDPTVRAATIGDSTWHYTLVDGKAILWRGKDEYRGEPCVDPKPTGKLKIPGKVDGYPVGELGPLAFFGCDGITDVEFPDSLERIGNRAFLGCHSLRRVTLPPNVKSLGIWAFNQCAALQDFDLANCTEIEHGGGQFAFCPAIERYQVSPDNQAYIADDGVLYSRDGKTLVAVPPMRTSLNIHDDVETIGDSAFFESRIREISIPRSVSYIGTGAFRNARALKTLTFNGPEPKCSDEAYSPVFAGTSHDLVIVVPPGGEGWIRPGRSGPPATWPRSNGHKVRTAFTEVSREWTSHDGRKRSATMVGISADKHAVMLRNAGEDKVRSCSISRLSDDDVRFIKSLENSLPVYEKRDGEWLPVAN